MPGGRGSSAGRDPLPSEPETLAEREPRRYRKLWLFVVLLTAVVALAPLLILTHINYTEFERSLRESTRQEIRRRLESTRRSLGSFLGRHLDALRFVVLDRTEADLLDRARLRELHDRLNRAWGGFVDLGVIDAEGRLLEYFGPYGLRGKSYREQEWFPEVLKRGSYISDVFLGFRKLPHFVIAVRGENERGEFYVLRATIDAEILTRFVAPLGGRPGSDAFVVNRRGVLQTPSRDGAVLSRWRGELPSCEGESEIRLRRAPEGGRRFVGCARIPESPFFFTLVAEPTAGVKRYLDLRWKLLGLTVGSGILILILIMATSAYLVYRIREGDMRRTEILHKIQYTSKMASIGRLAAGVAHEINNPLAIINEKAGLLKDLVGLAEDFPRREKFLALLDSVLSSVDRCRRITHRLLGFAKRMQVRSDRIDLEALLREVLSFLEKEALYRSIRLEVKAEEDLPSIESDRGQLQQVFLNILNNALQAVSDGGRVEIDIARRGPDAVSVSIADDGCGISPSDLEHIFEPFYTTKTEYGTGLGLSITYGIVTRLGGRIDVESKVGDGTVFTVVLPVRVRPREEE